MSNKVIILGLDGATFKVIFPLVKLGYLPTFRKLLSKGASSILKSTIPPLSASAWTSFSTGTKPSKHGIYDFIMKKPYSYETFYVNSNYVRVPFFWELLSIKGIKAGVVNVMVTYPPRPLKGFLITGGLTPSLANFTYPPQLGNELLKKFEWYPLFPPGGLTPKKGEDEKYVSLMLEYLDQRIRILRYLMMEKEWDIFVGVIGETDAILHAYLGLIGKSNMALKAILKIYAKIDRFLNEIINHFKNFTLIIMSDHGHEPVRKYLVLDAILVRYKLMNFRRDISSCLKLSMVKVGLSPYNLYNLVRSTGYRKSIAIVYGSVFEKIINELLLSKSNDVDWRRTVAFSIGTGGGIYINLEGREPEGIVPPSQYSKVLKMIKKIFYGITDEQGNAVIRKIYTKEDLYGNDVLAPDIVVVPRKGYFTVHRDQILSLKIFENPLISSHHDTDGIIIFYGNFVKNRGFIRNIEINLWDIAPTVFAILNLPIPLHFNGRVISDVIDIKSKITYDDYYQSYETYKRLRHRIRALRKISRTSKSKYEVQK